MDFDEAYYSTEIQGAVDHPHFLQRAEWIQDYVPSGAKVYILGCGFGHLVYHLRELGINAYGIESSSFAYASRVTPFIFHEKAEIFTYEVGSYVFSWNMLDCMTETTAILLSLQLRETNQLHVVCCSGDYDGYLIKDKEWWDILFNHVIDFEDPISLLHVPTSWGKVSH